MTTVKIKRYSVAFKQAVVREYEAGESLTSLGHKYGITEADLESVRGACATL
jgi:transposase-like protein